MIGNRNLIARTFGLHISGMEYFPYDKHCFHADLYIFKLEDRADLRFTVRIDCIMDTNACVVVIPIWLYL